MNKKSQIFEMLGTLIIVGITIVGTFHVYNQKDLIYVGITDKGVAYKYSECKDLIDTLPNEKLIVFTSEEKANQADFQIKDCNEQKK